MLYNPAVLDLRCAVVLTNLTVDRHSIASYGLHAHCIIAGTTVCTVGAVDGQDIALTIGDAHIAVCSIVNLSDHTGHIVLVTGVCIVRHCRTHCDSFRNCQGAASRNCGLRFGGLGGFLGSFYFLNLAEPGAELRNTNLRGIRNIGSQRSRNGSIGVECTQVPLRTDLCGINILMLQIQAPYSMLTAGLHNHINLGRIIVTRNHIQIGLGIAVHEVDVVAAIGCFQIHIHHIGNGICSAKVPTCHLAVECQEGLTLYLILIVAELVGSTNNRIRNGCALNDSIGGFAILHLAGLDELSYILGAAAGVAAVNVADPGSRNGFICTVSTQEILACGGQVYNVNTAIAVIYPVAGGLGGDTNAAALLTLIVGKFFDFDIGLSLAVQIVEAKTLAVTLGKHIRALAAGGGSLQTVAGDLAGKVNRVTGGLLIHIQPVSHIFLNRTVVHIPGTLGPAIQITFGIKFQLAVVVLNHTGNGDGISLTDLVDAVTDHTVALDLHAVYLHGNGHIGVLCAVCVIHADDLTGQGCTVGQRFAGLQLCSISQDLSSIGGGLLCHTAAADALKHHTAGIIFDLAVVVLDNTADSDQVVNCDFIHAGTLQTVAEHGILGITLNLDHNRDVAILGIIGRIDSDNSTGQGCGVGQAFTLFQSIGSLQNLTGIGQSLFGVALFYLLQQTAGIKLDSTLIVLQSTDNGNDIANQQVLDNSQSVISSLHTVALDGHILCTLNNDGDSDILIFVSPDRVDGDDLTDQTGLVRQALALAQCIGCLNDLHHILCLRQCVVPSMGSHIAVAIGDGSSQLIGGSFLALLVDIDGHSAVFIGNDLYQLFCHIGRPSDGKFDAADTDNAVAVEVYSGFGTVVLIKTLQVINGVLCAGTLNTTLRSGGCRLRCGGGIFCRFTAGKHAQHHNQKKHPC